MKELNLKFPPNRKQYVMFVALFRVLFYFMCFYIIRYYREKTKVFQLEVFCKKSVFKNLSEFTGKKTCPRVSFIIKVQLNSATLNIPEYLRTPNLMDIYKLLLLYPLFSSLRNTKFNESEELSKSC